MKKEKIKSFEQESRNISVRGNKIKEEPIYLEIWKEVGKDIDVFLESMKPLLENNYHTYTVFIGYIMAYYVRKFGHKRRKIDHMITEATADLYRFLDSEKYNYHENPDQLSDRALLSILMNRITMEDLGELVSELSEMEGDHNLSHVSQGSMDENPLECKKH